MVEVHPAAAVPLPKFVQAPKCNNSTKFKQVLLKFHSQLQQHFMVVLLEEPCLREKVIVKVTELLQDSFQKAFCAASKQRLHDFGCWLHSAFLLSQSVCTSHLWAYPRDPCRLRLRGLSHSLHCTSECQTSCCCKMWFPSSPSRSGRKPSHNQLCQLYPDPVYIHSYYITLGTWLFTKDFKRGTFKI